MKHNASLNELEKIKDSVVNGCMRCGFCMFFCPVYQETLDESSAARGKIALVKELLDGGLDITHDLLERLETCLLCNSCVANCPITVRSDRIILAARSDCVTSKHVHPIERFFFRNILLKRSLFGHTVKLISKLQRAFLRPDSDVSGSIRHLPDMLHGIQKGGNLPLVSNRFLRHFLPEVIRPPDGVETRAIVGFFSGCGLDFIYPQYGIDVVAFLVRQGIEVHFPKDQNCCGMPVFSRGDVKTAKRLAERNASAFSRYDVVLTACATCGSTLKNLEEYLGQGPEERQPIRFFSDKTVDINEYLMGSYLSSKTDLKAKTEFAGKTATWHDPCHLVRHQAIKDQPRQILRAVSNMRYTEMPDADRCCGMGGTFSINHQELSQKIAQRKMDAIRASGADLVVTSCPGCLIQFNDALLRNGMKQKAVHIMSLFE